MLVRSSEYYAFWLKARSNALVEEFADILADAFAPDAERLRPFSETALPRCKARRCRRML